MKIDRFETVMLALRQRAQGSRTACPASPSDSGVSRLGGIPRITRYFGQSGFTLVELIIVISLISVLATGTLMTVNPFAQIQKAHDGRRKSDLATVQKALEVFYQDYGHYPPSSPDFKIMSVGWGAPWSPYMDVLPKDPTSTKQYVYYADSSGQAYYLYASLDRASTDPSACQGACANVPLGANCGGVCNYGVTSPNVSP